MMKTRILSIVALLLTAVTGAWADDFTINIPSLSNGSVVAKVGDAVVTSAAADATVSLVATPDAGYRLKSISGVYETSASKTETLNSTATTVNGTKFKAVATARNNYGWRVYNPGSANTLTISSKDGTPIKKIELTSTWGNSRKNNMLSVTAGTLSFDGSDPSTTVTINNINATSVTINGSGNSAGTTWCISSAKIYYEATVETAVEISDTENANVKTFTMPSNNVTVSAEFESIVNVSGVTLSQTEASMTVGGTQTLTANVLPDNATDKTVTWTTSNASVATVANGVVTAVAAGTATITATATNGTDDTSDDFSATCTVAVSNPTANEGGDGNYWSTFYNATQGYTADASTTIYKGKLNGSSLTLTEVTDIAAGQAVILKSTTGTITLTPAATTSSNFSDNDLKGGTTVTSGYDAYTLSRGNDGTGAVGFYKFSGSLDGSKAHLEIKTSAGSRSFIGFVDDNTTGIELPALADDEAAEWYSLDGRRLSGKPARKGIYVRNGQKIIIK